MVERLGVADMVVDEATVPETPPPRHEGTGLGVWGKNPEDQEALTLSPLSPWPFPPDGTQCQSSNKVHYSDRLIPSRAASDLETGFDLLNLHGSDENSRGVRVTARRGGNTGDRTDENSAAYERLLRWELLGLSTPAPLPPSPHSGSSSAVPSAAVARPASQTQTPRTSQTQVARASSPVGRARSNVDDPPLTPERRSSNSGLFRYRSAPGSPAVGSPGTDDAGLASVPCSPLTLRSSGTPPEAPRKPPRKVPSEPFKVLSAPRLEDDFYVSTLDCSCSDVVAVGLGNSVDLWNARTGRASRLCDLANGLLTSLSWAPDGVHVAVGTSEGEVQLWDAAACQKIRTMEGHTRRVGTLAWANSSVLSSGGRDHSILNRDMRQQSDFIQRLRGGHSEEVCGLKWSADQQLASGGNEGNVCVWTLKSNSPLLRFSEHEAAVKALAWSPHQRGLLATGGGTADKRIRFFSTLRGVLLSSVYTGSQVCNMLWSNGADEILSTHGYPGNEIILWRYHGMSRLATLEGHHRARVLHLAALSDGRSIVTGAGDETLRFWSILKGPKPQSTSPATVQGLPSQLLRTIR